MRAWNLMFLPGSPLQPDPHLSPEQNRGAYLVEALGHCGECHTPRNQLYGLDSSQKFAGAVTAGWEAYNITSDGAGGIGSWSDQDVASYLSQGFAHGHCPASGSMGEAVEYSLSHLTADDIEAMTAYLRTIPPHPAPGEAPVEQRPQAVAESTAVTPPQREADTASLGLEIFQSACASCHAYDGTGVNDPRAALLGSQTVNDPHGINLIQVLLRGSHVRIEQTEASMPSVRGISRRGTGSGRKLRHYISGRSQRRFLQAR